MCVWERDINAGAYNFLELSKLFIYFIFYKFYYASSNFWLNKLILIKLACMLMGVENRLELTFKWLIIYIVITLHI